ncbi:MAG: cell division/cell wall cluster transcriptional repressor MraZ [Synergistaceae bacterium]|nr:cell division/cell wall cluster transcriptional repressor MraZ [Synergistaceae bacterium]
MGLIGNFDHKIDAKGRLVLPACFREELGSRVVAAITEGTCVSVYSQSSWESVIERLEDIAVKSTAGADIKRRVLANSFHLEIDSMGRILVPEKLRSRLQIGPDVCVNGNNKKLEIWDLSTWQKFMNDSEPLATEINVLIPGL